MGESLKKEPASQGASEAAIKDALTHMVQKFVVERNAFGVTGEENINKPLILAQILADVLDRNHAEKTLTPPHIEEDSISKEFLSHPAQSDPPYILSQVLKEGLPNREHVFLDEATQMQISTEPYKTISAIEYKKLKDPTYKEVLINLEKIIAKSDALLGLSCAIMSILNPDIFTSSTTPGEGADKIFIPIISLPGYRYSDDHVDMRLPLSDNLSQTYLSNAIDINIVSLVPKLDDNYDLRFFRDTIHNWYKTWLSRRILYNTEDIDLTHCTEKNFVIGEPSSGKSSITKHINTIPYEKEIKIRSHEAQNGKLNEVTSRIILTTPKRAVIEADRIKKVKGLATPSMLGSSTAVVEPLALQNLSTGNVATPVKEFTLAIAMNPKVYASRPESLTPHTTVKLISMTDQPILHVISARSEGKKEHQRRSQEIVPPLDMSHKLIESSANGLHEKSLRHIIHRFAKIFLTASSTTQMSLTLNATKQADIRFISSKQTNSNHTLECADLLTQAGYTTASSPDETSSPQDLLHHAASNLQIALDPIDGFMFFRSGKIIKEHIRSRNQRTKSHQDLIALLSLLERYNPYHATYYDRLMLQLKSYHKANQKAMGYSV